MGLTMEILIIVALVMFILTLLVGMVTAIVYYIMYWPMIKSTSKFIRGCDDSEEEA